MKKLIIILVCALLFTSCHRLTKGVIENLYHHDSYTSTSFIMVGKVMVPTTTWHPENWECDVRGEFSGDTITENYDISEFEYNAWMVGDSVRINSNDRCYKK